MARATVKSVSNDYLATASCSNAAGAGSGSVKTCLIPKPGANEIWRFWLVRIVSMKGDSVVGLAVFARSNGNSHLENGWRLVKQNLFGVVVKTACGATKT